MPDYLAAVPLDPFSGDPLRMARQADALIVYSVGLDFEDSGGTPCDDETCTGDVTFRVPLGVSGDAP